MKKQLLIFIVTAMCFGNYLYAQSIPNGSFENWTSTPYDIPNAWYTSNDQALQAGIINVTKVGGVTGSAIRLETKKLGVDTFGAYFTNSNGNPTKGQGGSPYSQLPTAVTGKYMANMVGNDSAVLLILFKKNGSIIGMNAFTLGGKGQTTFSSFSFPLMCSTTPDTVVIAAASSNLISNVGVAVGSNIVFDDLAFTGTGITQTISNGNFDAWTSTSFDKINGWNMGGQGISKTTDSYKGSYAAKLQTTNTQGFVSPSEITTGNTRGNQGGGYPFTNQVDTIFGYYKYTPVNGDTATVYATVSKNGANVGYFSTYLFAASTYTYFEVPTYGFAATDSLQVTFVSSSFSNPMVGSILTVDEVQLKSQILHTGILSANYNMPQYSLYPNPVTNILNIVSNITKNQSSTISISDITGKVIFTDKNNATDQISIHTDFLKSGIYFYNLETESGEIIRGKFVKE